MKSVTAPRISVGGDPYEMGLAHGAALARSVRSYAAERMALARSPVWTGRSASEAEVMDLAKACLRSHEELYPDLVEELRGVSDATGVGLPELIVSGGFTDFVDVMAAAMGSGVPAPGIEDDCTAFIVPGARMTTGAPAFGQTWDMHEGSAEHLVVMEGRPRSAPAFVVLTTSGCVGMMGMNEAGLVVGINNLTAADGRPGVTWPFVVRAMLRSETTAGALAVLAEAPLAGGHNYVVLDASGAGANVEAMPSASATTVMADDPVVHTNHCLDPRTVAVERPRESSSQAESEARLARARQLLARSAMDVDYLQAVTADPDAVCRTGEAPGFIGTCGAIVARPDTRELWVVAGRPSEAPYERAAVPTVTR